MIGCATPEERHKVLSFFFDGVPPPRKEGEEEKTKEVKMIPKPPGGEEKFKDWIAKVVPGLESKKKEKEVQATAQPAPTAPPEEKRPPIEKLEKWEEVLALLPKDEAGNVDWVKAIKGGVIAPRASIDPKAPDEPVEDLDIELIPEDKEYKVIFSHSTHTMWLTCDNCHPDIFNMEKGADPITMDKINAGEYCGQCHGKVAFDVENCDKCHQSLAEGGSN